MIFTVDLREASPGEIENTSVVLQNAIMCFSSRLTRIELLCADGQSVSAARRYWSSFPLETNYLHLHGESLYRVSDDKGKIITNLIVPTAKMLGDKAVDSDYYIYAPAKCMTGARVHENGLASSNEYSSFIKKSIDCHTDDQYEGNNAGLDYIMQYLAARPERSCFLERNCQANHMYVDGKGDAFPCEALKGKAFHYGNILTDDFDDILSSSKRRIFYERALHAEPVCYTCDYFGQCNKGCPALALLETGNFRNRSRFDCAANREVFPYVLERASRYKKEEKQHYEADLKVGCSCNNECIHCVADDTRKYLCSQDLPVDLSSEEIRSIIADLDTSYTALTLTGGEATIRDDFFDILELAHQRGLEINLQTNGRRFCEDDVAKRLAKYEVSVVLALHGSSAAIHDEISGVEGSFEQTTKGIENLIHYGNPVTGKIVLSKVNMDDLKNIASLFNALGVYRINVAFPHGKGRAWQNKEKVIPRYADIIHSIKDLQNYNLDRLMLGKPSHITFEAVPFCHLNSQEQACVEAKIFVTRMLIDSKAVTDETFFEFAFEDQRKKVRACKQCAYDSVCPGPWSEYSDLYGEDEFKPIDLDGMDLDFDASPRCKRGQT